MTSEVVAAARSLLFVPGDRPERFPKALAAGAGVVIVDLEDAVDPSRKALARSALAGAVASGMSVAVRVNAPGTADHDLDLAALASVRTGLTAVVVAKAERPDDLLRVGVELQSPVIALIESAQGLVASAELARLDPVARLAFGAVDYALDIDADGDPDVLAYPRSMLVVASRAAGLPSPIDSPSLEFRDGGVVSTDARVARRFGMGGKLCIHPAQVAAVEAAFRPSSDEVAAAHALLAASDGEGAGAIDGLMVDRPVLERARRVLRAAGGAS